MRTAEIDRETRETRIALALALDGEPRGEIATGVGFFDHMLELLAHHAALGLTIRAEGDLETGAHHTVEDVGICLGQALDRALGERAGIARYGHAVVPMDEARGSCALDVSGRPFLVWSVSLPPGAIGDFDHELAEEFFRAVANNARLTLHLVAESGTNTHHVIEALFKAFARALRAAVGLTGAPGVPSTKGVL